MEGTSRTRKETQTARGTASYRAPELIALYDMLPTSFNNKVDIWALGCILHDIVFKVQLFLSDYSVVKGNWEVPTATELPVDARSRFVLESLFNSLLLKSSWERPNTEQILQLLSILPQDATEVWLTGCPHPLQTSFLSTTLGTFFANWSRPSTPDNGPNYCL